MNTRIENAEIEAKSKREDDLYNRLELEATYHAGHPYPLMELLLDGKRLSRYAGPQVNMVLIEGADKTYEVIYGWQQDIKVREL